MILLRSLLYQGFFAGSVVVFASLILLVSPFAHQDTIQKLGRRWAALNLSAMGWICNLHYHIQGFENLPGENAVVLSKHQSTWETIALRAILPIEQTWVLKRELMSVPFFGWALRLFHPIAINRADGRHAITMLVRDGVRFLKEGRWVIIFPEGTRVMPGVRSRYSVGGALLAERAHKPVLPIAHNAGNFWGRRSLRMLPGTIEVVIGPLIETQGRKASEINTEVENWIESRVAELPQPIPAD